MLISIITPVYNAEKYLKKCIGSILSQTFTDFELLLINDGSPDRSGEICDEYASKDSRIRVFHKSNGGVSSARNVGLDNARGEWICFVDSDDFVGEKYLTDLCKGIAPESPCLVFQGFNHYNASLIKFKETTFQNIILTRDEFSKAFNTINIMCFGYPFSKLYFRQVLNTYSIRFDCDIHMGEDSVFMLQYIEHITIISFSSAVNYNYTQINCNSLMKKTHSFESEMKLIQTLHLILDRNKLVWGIETDSPCMIEMANHVFRALLAMYRPQNISEKKIRIERLKKICLYYSLYIKSYAPSELQTLIMKKLLNTGYINILDHFKSKIYFLRHKLPVILKRVCLIFVTFNLFPSIIL